MQWNKRFITTLDYPYVGDKIGVYPTFQSYLKHIKKRLQPESKPIWLTILNPANDKKNLFSCKITEDQAVEIYDGLADEIEKAVHFFFLTDCYVYVQKCEESQARIFGISPAGFTVILSEKNVLTVYFPGNASHKSNTTFHRFCNGLNKTARKAIFKKKRAGEAITKKDEMIFPYVCQNQNRFLTFWKQYCQLKVSSETKAVLRELLKEAKP